MFFLGILPTQCKIRRNQPSDTRRSVSRCDRRIGHPWSISAFKASFLWL